MSVLLASALLAAAASVIATGCVAYVLISFGRSGHLLSSRLGRQELSLVTAGNSRRRRVPATHAVAARPLRLQPVRAY